MIQFDYDTDLQAVATEAVREAREATAAAPYGWFVQFACECGDGAYLTTPTDWPQAMIPEADQGVQELVTLIEHASFAHATRHRVLRMTGQPWGIFTA